METGTDIRGTKKRPGRVPIDPVELANLLRPILVHINRQLRKELHAVGVSAGQVSLLVAIRDQPGIGIGELAAREGTSAPSICNHIDRLAATGLVIRHRAVGGDRRRVGLRLTPDGSRVLRAVRSRRTAWLASRLEAMEPDELAALDAAVGPLAKVAPRGGNA